MTNFTYTGNDYNPTFVRTPSATEKLLTTKVFTNSLQFKLRKDPKGLIAKALEKFPFELDNYVGLYDLDIPKFTNVYTNLDNSFIG